MNDLGPFVNGLFLALFAVALTVAGLRELRKRRLRREEEEDLPFGEPENAGDIGSHADLPVVDAATEKVRSTGDFVVGRDEFDEAGYLAANPDVAIAGTDPWQHWVTYGRREGRRLRPG